MKDRSRLAVREVTERYSSGDIEEEEEEEENVEGAKTTTTCCGIDDGGGGRCSAAGDEDVVVRVLASRGKDCRNVFLVTTPHPFPFFSKSPMT